MRCWASSVALSKSVNWGFKMTMEPTFAALAPLPTSLLIGGETLEIVPLKVGELPAFARAVRPIAAKLGPDPDWLQLLSEDGEAVILAVAIACRRAPDWVAGLAVDEAVCLGEALFQVNADFFIRRVVPQITQMSSSIKMPVSQPPGAATPGAMPFTGC